MTRWPAVLVFWGLLGAVCGAQLGTVPFTFNPGTPILSAEVNTNFATAYALALNRQAGVMTGTLTTQAIQPITTNVWDLGTSLLRYRDGWFGRDLGVGGNISVTGTIFDPDSPVTIGDNLQITSATTPQLTLGPDTSNALKISVGPTGIVTFDAVGSGASFTFSDLISGADSIAESAIADGTILARVAANETITGAWVFGATPALIYPSPLIMFHHSTAAFNEKRWYLQDTGVNFGLYLQDDAGTYGGASVVWQRNGATPVHMYVYTPITIESLGPSLTFRETNAPLDEKTWQWRATDGDFYLTMRSDDGSLQTDALRVLRNGGNPTGISILAPKIYAAQGAGAPTYTFWGNETTGMFSPGANDLRLVAGDQYLRVSSTGISLVNASVFLSHNLTANGTGNFSSGLTSGETIQARVGIASSAGSITAESGAIVAGNGMFMADGQARFRATAAGGGGTVAIERMADDGTLISFERNGAGVGSVTVAGGVVAYNTFLGSHYVQVKGQIQEGEVVISTGDAIGNRFVYVEASTRRNQAGVYGVLLGPTTVERRTWGDLTKPVFQVAGLGQFQVWVTDTCGEIRNGDLLAASPRRGLAERQCTDDGKPDNVVRSTTLGKALVNVTWDGVRRKRIPVVLMTG